MLVGFGLTHHRSRLLWAIIWRLSRRDEEREERALHLIAVSLFAFAVYVTAQSGFDLVAGSEPESSASGLTLAVASLIRFIDISETGGDAKRRIRPPRARQRRSIFRWGACRGGSEDATV